MGTDRMSISFLAPSQEEDPPWSTSSVSLRSPIQQDPVSRINSHCNDARSRSIRFSGLSTARQQEKDLKDDQYRRDSRGSTSPLSTIEHNDGGEEDYPGNFRRQPRAPRPTYSEDQRFYVMYARLIEDKTWPIIEEDFAHIFKQRSKGGLCSLYYRTRRSWGLEDVLKSDSNCWTLECRVIDDKARNFSRDF